MSARKPRGEATRERRQRAYSGPNIPEAQRHTRRVRIPKELYELAERGARRRRTSIAEEIARALRAAYE